LTGHAFDVHYLPVINHKKVKAKKSTFFFFPEKYFLKIRVSIISFV